jgi:hypothetical protein
MATHLLISRGAPDRRDLLITYLILAIYLLESETSLSLVVVLESQTRERAGNDVQPPSLRHFFADRHFASYYTWVSNITRLLRPMVPYPALTLPFVGYIQSPRLYLP